MGMLCSWLVMRLSQEALSALSGTVTMGEVPLRQQSCPLGLTSPPGGPTDDHETDR